MNDPSAAGIPPGLREEWASHLAQIPQPETAAGALRLFLFRSGPEWFGIDARILLMTAPWVRPRRLPHQRGRIIEGVVNADGRVIFCLSMERFAGIQRSESVSTARRLLVFSRQKWPFALGADEVLGIEDVEGGRSEPLPASAGEALRKCSQGIVLHRGRAVVCLDADRFVSQLQEGLR